MTLHIPLISSDSHFPYYRRQGLNLIINEKYFFLPMILCLLSDDKSCTSSFPPFSLKLLRTVA